MYVLAYVMVMSANLIMLPVFALSSSAAIRRDVAVRFDVATDAFYFLYGAFRGANAMNWGQVMSICFPCVINAFR